MYCICLIVRGYYLDFFEGEVGSFFEGFMSCMLEFYVELVIINGVVL